MNRVVVGASCVYLVASSLALLGQAQTQPPTFKTGVQLVRIDVSVLDDKRQPVRGSRASDFTVLEDGRPGRDTPDGHRTRDVRRLQGVQGNDVGGHQVRP